MSASLISLVPAYVPRLIEDRRMFSDRIAAVHGWLVDREEAFAKVQTRLRQALITTCYVNCTVKVNNI